MPEIVQPLSQLMGRDGFPGLVGRVGHVHVEDIVEPEPEAVPGFKRVGYALGRTVPVIVKIVCRVLHLLVDALLFPHRDAGGRQALAVLAVDSGRRGRVGGGRRHNGPR